MATDRMRADRRPIEERIAVARARLNQMEAQRVQAQRKADTVRKIVVGGTVLAAMESDPDLHHRVVALLREKLTRPRDREAVSQWLSSQEG